ncbi:hypothetical protein [Nitrobacter sp. TKz-YC02]|uniref:hypothetical protein n=1 Tax=Nitrobacter sp. TKz-YC02 TaxID=3398704 RepID=UPI003CFA4B5A
MSSIHIIPEPAVGRPRTIAHALDLLRAYVVAECDTVISVGPPLPIAKRAQSFCLNLKVEEHDITHAVLLPACSRVQAIPEGSSTVGTFQVEDFDGALVNSNGVAVLKNGMRLRGIEPVPTPFPKKFSRTDQQTFIALIELTKGERKVYRPLRKGIPKLVRKGVPKLHFVDFTALSKRLARPSIGIPSLKEIQTAYSIKYENERAPTLSKISETLKNLGIRTTGKRSPKSYSLCKAATVS